MEKTKKMLTHKIQINQKFLLANVVAVTNFSLLYCTNKRGQTFAKQFYNYLSRRNKKLNYTTYNKVRQKRMKKPSPVGTKK